MANADRDARHVELIAGRCRQLRSELEMNLAGYRARQDALAERFRVARVVPRPYTETTRTAILKQAGQCVEPWEFAWTSGTTSEPKQILYPASRVQSLADHLVDQVLLAAADYGVTSPRFCFLNTFAADRSLSGLLARACPSSPAALEIFGDYFAFRLVAMKLADRYSPLALCWALIWSLRPTVVTTVNPSSLCMLLRNGRAVWAALYEQVRQILIDDDWRAVCDERGQAAIRSEVLDWLAATPDPPAPAGMLPHLELIYCWQGGYVRPFVDQLRESLAPRQPHLAPMFSLSTEVVAASIFPHLSRQAGLPIYPGCCYEFLPRDAEAAADDVLRPWDLVPGEEYRMVVSDTYGLVRYDTEDVFRCVGHVGDAPLIDFVRRHGLNYSFTGEKLTDSQLQAAYAEVAQANGLCGAAFTCFPCRGSHSLPGYVLIVLASDCALDREQTARQFDEALGRINSEYASKRATDRLAAPSLITMPPEAFAAKLARALPRTAGANPAQFKLLPLYTLLWEDVLAAGKDSP